jgi:hypothetical protein
MDARYVIHQTRNEMRSSLYHVVINIYTFISGVRQEAFQAVTYTLFSCAAHHFLYYFPLLRLSSNQYLFLLTLSKTRELGL